MAGKEIAVYFDVLDVFYAHWAQSERSVVCSRPFLYYHDITHLTNDCYIAQAP